MHYTYRDIAKMIDHSLVNPVLPARDLEKGCELALAYDVASVCILPWYLRRCAGLLAGSDVRAGTTVGFPHGSHTTEVKVAEAMGALRDGCQELDMVVNISAVLSGEWAYVRHAPQHVQVKAAGGVRDLDTLLRVREIGVTRCGATRTAAMLDECRKRLGLEPVSVIEPAAAPGGY
jgi:deoxyribose-phosphate aldolase